MALLLRFALLLASVSSFRQALPRGRLQPWLLRVSTSEEAAEVLEDSGGSSEIIRSIDGKDDFFQIVGDDQVPGGTLRVVKFWAPWCRACKGLEPKYKRIAQQYPGFEFLQLNWEENRVFCKEIGVAALPMVKMFTSDGEVESFACGPKKVELLRAKLDEWKAKLGVPEAPATPTTVTTTAAAVPEVVKGKPTAAVDIVMGVKLGGDGASKFGAAGEALRELGGPLFGNLTTDQLNALLEGSPMTTNTDGDVIIQQGDIGQRFFMILTGEVDIFKSTGFGGFADRTPWGTPVNRLGPGQYFGEHALITGEPRWASVVAASEEVRCLAFDKNILEQIDPKTWLNSSFRPEVWGIESLSVPASVSTEETEIVNQGAQDPKASSLPMVVRYKLMSTAVRAFNHAKRRTPKWGDPEELEFRNALVGQLSEGQMSEFKQCFKLFDRDGNGEVESWELARVLNLDGRRSVSEQEVLDMINKANPSVDGNTALTEKDFIAMMAEAEYSNFFLDTFAMLDSQGNGWVSASQLLSLMKEFNEESSTLSESKMMKMMEEFGMDEEGHIDYEHFVSVLMSLTVS